MISTNSEILNKLFLQEHAELVNKYNNLSVELESNLNNLMFELNEDTKEYLLEESNLLLKLLNHAELLSVDEMLYLVWHHFNIGIRELSEDLVEKFNSLKNIGYIEIDDYIVYREGKHLKEYMYTFLEDKLDDEYYIDSLFDKEDIIKLWVNNTDKYEIIEDLIHTETIENLIGEEANIAFTTQLGEVYKYIKCQ